MPRSESTTDKARRGSSASRPKRLTLPSTPLPTVLLMGIFFILLTAALRLGAGLLLPVAISCLFTLLLDRPVRALHRLGISTSLAAALVVFGSVAIMGSGVVMLAGPAADWIETAPRTLGKVQSRIRKLTQPLQETAKKVEEATAPKGPGEPQTVQIKEPGFLTRLSVSTTSFAAAVVTVVFLTYFLLAMLPVLRAKLADLIEPGEGEGNVEAVLAEMESQMSSYMLVNTMTSVGVGVATGILVAVVGLPNPILWGVVATFLNYIPYAGALVTVVLLGSAALVTFTTTGPVLVIVGGSVVINLLEGNLVTPHLMGKHLPLNPVAIFLSLVYWGWVWGGTGALLAVPMMVMVQVISARVDRLHVLAVLLES